MNLRSLILALILSFFSMLFCNMIIAAENAATPQIRLNNTTPTIEQSHPQSKDINISVPDNSLKKSTAPKRIIPMGYCCKNGKNTKSSADICKKKRGVFYSSKKNAEEKCTGFCCSDFTVVQTSQQKCRTTHGNFFPAQQQAYQFCARQKGYCIDGEEILRLTQNQCTKKKGSFLTSYTLAKQSLSKIQRQLQFQKTSGKDAKSIKVYPQQRSLRTTLPDLYLSNKKWSAQPKFGDKIGYSPLLNLTVTNKGTAISSQTSMEIVPVQAPGGVSSSDNNILQMSIQIPPLKPGKTFSFSWPQPSEEKWRKGTYQTRFSISVDPAGEMDETNNDSILYFTCQSSSLNALTTEKPQLSVKKSLPIISNKPDLIATLEAPDAILYHDFLYTFRGGAENIGGVPAPVSRLSLGLLSNSGAVPLDGRSTPALGSPSGSAAPTAVSFELKSKIPTTCNGSKKLYIQVDPANLIDEANEDNNVITYDVECRTPYDYYDLGLFEKGSQEELGLKYIGYTNESVNYSIKVYNFRNNSQSPKTQLIVSCDSKSDQTVVVEPISASDVTSNNREFHFSNSWSNGLYQCQAKLSNVVGFTDADKSNNQMSFSVEITGHLPTANGQ